MFPAPPQPGQPSRKGTPFTHCAAAAAVWYAAFTVAHVAALGSGLGVTELLVALLIGLLHWAPTTVVTWLVLMRVRLQPWVVIIVVLPVFVVVWVLLQGVMGALSRVYGFLVG
ncbi:hypothetical protein [Lentzea sp. E54]|uniref:hypothetical protein n=1 Tax=Lentzea xerophila TaxID=3435883 RepID=UPI003DA2CF01